MITYKNWYDYLIKEVENGSIYLWGGQGEPLYVLTDEYIKKKETSSSNANRVISLRDKRVSKGKVLLKAFDCSGLGIYKLLLEKEISNDMTAHGIYTKSEKIEISQLRPGDFVFRLYTAGSSKGHVYHIGYVVDDLSIIHAKGRDVGVVKETLNQNGSNYWNAYGRSPWVENKNPVYDYVFNKNLKKGMTGEAVKNLQALLLDNNFNCGSIDGVFGKNTLKAVKAAQKSSKLKVDGIAGKNTIKALGGIWLKK